jgi:hypothetical protein
LEWSIVNIPSNPDAIKRNMDDVIKTILPTTTKESTRTQRAISLFEAQLSINKNKAK